MPGKTAYTSSNLGIRNPYHVHSFFELGLSAALAVLLLAFIPRFVAAAKTHLELFDQGRLDGSYSVSVLFAVIFWIFAITCAVMTLRNLIRGIHHLLSFIVPPGIPKNLDSIKTILNVLDNRVIDSFESSSALQRVASFFSNRYLYLTHTPKEFAKATIRSSTFWLIWLPLFIVPTFFASAISKILGATVSYPFPIMLVVVVIILVAVQIVATGALTPAVPELNLVERRTHLLETGNPNNFFSFIMNELDEIRYEDFQNRCYAQKQPLSDSIQTGDTNIFDGIAIIETQPVPLNQVAAGPGGVMDAGGLALIFLGYLFAFSICALRLGSSPTASEDLGAAIPALFVSTIAVFTAISHGRRFMNQAFSLFNRFLYSSNLIALKLQGTHTASTIGLGDGRGGQAFSKRTSIQSDTDITLKATQLTTETEGLEGKRIIISAGTPPDFVATLNRFIEGLNNFRDSSGRLAGIDLTDNRFAELADANIILAGKMSAVQEAGKRMARNQLPAEALDQHRYLSSPQAQKELGAGDTKICPRCAETIKLRAKVCRFCGQEFPEVTD